MIQKLNCVSCGCTLYNDVNTFGEVGQEMCWTCWSRDIPLEDIRDMEDEGYYGLAPHHHDTTITGSLIGSTVYEPLPGEPNENGEYWIPDRNAWFWPDPEMDGMMGVWREKP